MPEDKFQLCNRFRGYYPVVIDVETAGFNALQDALLEVAAVTLKMDENGQLHMDKTFHYHVLPFHGANLEQSALDFNGIDPYCALRGAISEQDAITDLCKHIRKGQKQANCQRSVIVAHNAAFDQSFINAAIDRVELKRSPFHPFVSFDTTSLAGLAFGQTVLAKACKAAGMDFDQKEAHSAIYDAQKTAQLFCTIVNKWHDGVGWPMS
ncbi:ribonuclease T [Paraneptunicella aestuarii]|uniref:ribonuclease T n=1 Tax=Paraneptunicella aestuarii TaxID=2831148 RepID=UPI001E5F4954|nr:ribonuclease T [Paraneptunicella aestuarii]UAA40827.1 ribonuclease T [Paraneptunicella aestuarii]